MDMTMAHPVTDTVTDPADLTATQARAMISRRQLSPVELAEACITRTNAVNHAVNALVAWDFDRLLDEARAAEAALTSGAPLGAVHGLPFGVKDMIDVAGLPTTFGSTIYRDNVATKDSAIVAQMRAAGGGVLGKTNNPEFSAGGNTRNAVYGVTANPFDLTKTCAGSSGGSAVALAVGMAPLCTGSDTGGSLRNPAAFCGVVGFRPSPGAVPGTTRGPALIPLPTSGPMGRTVADVGLMLSVMATPDRSDPYTFVTDGKTPWNPADFTRLPRVDLGRLKVAMTEDYGFSLTQNVVREAFRARCEALAPQFGQLDAATPDCTNADRIFAVLRAVMMLSGHATNMANHADQMGPNVTDNWNEGLSYSAQDVAQALSMQGAYYRNWQLFFEDYDYVISPAVTVSPFDWRDLYPQDIDGVKTQSYYHWLSQAYASTIAGHPSISLPLGRDALGLPFGFQIVGRRGDDLGVLAVAAEIEALFAGDATFGRPKADIEMLKATPPLSQQDGFLGFA